MARSFLKRALKRVKPEPAAPPVEEPPTEPATRETTLLPVEILADNLRTITAALAAEGVASWLVSDETAIRGVVGIMADDRPGLARALARLADDGYWVRLPNKARPEAELATFDLAELVTLSPALVLFTRYTLPGGSVLIRGDYSCEVELWEREERGGVGYVVAPRENRAAKRLSADAFELVPTTWHGVAAVTPRPFLDRMVDDVTFPIDVVYTWVDGSDPHWLEKRARAEAEEKGLEFHPEATMASRFA
ncbi:MAG TPA: Stealth CR1 domain-containing protein, partial [Arachnia sp.]|nr:Stealth CR1 domain-containing protein [Arachnia sp.]